MNSEQVKTCLQIGAAASTLAVHLYPRLKYVYAWTNNKLFQGSIKGELVRLHDVKTLKNRLDSGRVILKEPLKVNFKGTFLPASLLNKGWWERRNNPPKYSAPNATLERWLNHGFVQWGPSYDNNVLYSRDLKKIVGTHFIGQIGRGDEADSLPIVMPISKLNNIYEDCPHLIERNVNNKLMAVEAQVEGHLYHKKTLKRMHPNIYKELKNSNPFMKNAEVGDYCILVKDDEGKGRQGFFPKLKDTKQVYSGYMWLCVCPQKVLKEKKKNSPVDEKDLIFIWEHTDFTSPDSVAYNRDSLEFKYRYIENKRGPMALIAKSMWFASEREPDPEASEPAHLMAHMANNKCSEGGKR